MANASTLTAWQVPPALVASTKPVYGFYVSYGMRYMFQHFATLYAAKRFLDILFAGQNARRKDDFTLVSNDGLTARMENPRGRKGPSMLNEVLQYELSPTEQQFMFTPQLLAHYQNFTSSKIAAEAAGPQTPSNDQQTTAKVAQRAPSAPKPAPKAPKQTKPDGLVTIATIAADLKVDAKQARQALRKAKIAKPDHGWAFHTDQVSSITAAIKEHLK